MTHPKWGGVNKRPHPTVGGVNKRPHPTMGGGLTSFGILICCVVVAGPAAVWKAKR